MAALQLMVQTYTANPQYGDVDQFSDELNTATQRVEVLQSGVQLLSVELSGVSSRLDQIRLTGSTFSTPEYGRRKSVSPGESVVTSEQSASVGYVSAVSSSTASDKDYESIDQENDKENDTSEVDCDNGQKINSFTMVDNDSELLKIYASEFYGWTNNGEDFPSPPPPPTPPPPLPSSDLGTVVALYPFVGESDSNIPMVEGEQFQVTEGDMEGWIKVRRVDGRFFPDEGEVEGFVPTAFVRFIT